MSKLCLLPLIALLLLSACTETRDKTNANVEHYKRSIGYLQHTSDRQICNLAYDFKKQQWRLTDTYALMELQVRGLECDGQTFNYKFKGLEDYIAYRKTQPYASSYKPKSHALNKSLQHVSDQDLCKQASWGQYGYNHSAPYYAEEVFARKAHCEEKLSKQITKTDLNILCDAIAVAPKRFPNLSMILKENNFSCESSVDITKQNNISDEDKLCALATNSDWRPNKDTKSPIRTWDITGNPEAVAEAKNKGLTCGTSNFVNPNSHYN